MFDFAEARAHMVESQVRTNDVTDPAIQRAMGRIAREAFLPARKKSIAYSDVHIETDPGRFMMSPRDFAKLLQAADIQSTDIVLDLACGRGYSTAVLGALAETVVAMESDEALVEQATNLLTDSEIMNVAVVAGDLKGGAPAHGPFNVIFVNGAVQGVPKPWLEQLANEGRLVVIENDGPLGQAKVYTKTGDSVGERTVFDSGAPVLPEFVRAPAFVF